MDGHGHVGKFQTGGVFIGERNILLVLPVVLLFSDKIVGFVHKHSKIQYRVFIFFCFCLVIRNQIYKAVVTAGNVVKGKQTHHKSSRTAGTAGLAVIRGGVVDGGVRLKHHQPVEVRKIASAVLVFTLDFPYHLAVPGKIQTVLSGVRGRAGSVGNGKVQIGGFFGETGMLFEINFIGIKKSVVINDVSLVLDEFPNDAAGERGLKLGDNLHVVFRN